MDPRTPYRAQSGAHEIWIKDMSEKRKGDRPETIRQALTWENLKNHYVDAGLCNGCAGQAAYGHQLGFTRIKDPCTACRSVVLPDKLVNRHGDRGQKWLALHFSGVTAEVIADE